MLITLWLGWSFISWLVAGPAAPLYVKSFSDCKTLWWTNFLMINNFYPAKSGEGSCMWWTWYLSVDFQLYLLLPFVVLLLKKAPSVGFYGSVAIIPLSIIATGVQNSQLSEPGFGPAFSEAYLTSVFMKPWARMASYFIGVVLAVRFFHQMRRQDENALNTKTWVPFILYFVGFSLMTAVYVVMWSFGKSLNWGSSA